MSEVYFVGGIYVTIVLTWACSRMDKAMNSVWKKIET